MGLVNVFKVKTHPQNFDENLFIAGEDVMATYSILGSSKHLNLYNASEVGPKHLATLILAHAYHQNEEHSKKFIQEIISRIDDKGSNYVQQNQEILFKTLNILINCQEICNDNYLFKFNVRSRSLEAIKKAANAFLGVIINLSTIQNYLKTSIFHNSISNNAVDFIVHHASSNQFVATLASEIINNPNCCEKKKYNTLLLFCLTSDRLYISNPSVITFLQAPAIEQFQNKDPIPLAKVLCCEELENLYKNNDLNAVQVKTAIIEELNKIDSLETIIKAGNFLGVLLDNINNPILAAKLLKAPSILNTSITHEKKEILEAKDGSIRVEKTSVDIKHSLIQRYLSSQAFLIELLMVDQSYLESNQVNYSNLIENIFSKQNLDSLTKGLSKDLANLIIKIKPGFFKNKSLKEIAKESLKFANYIFEEVNLFKQLKDKEILEILATYSIFSQNKELYTKALQNNTLTILAYAKKNKECFKFLFTEEGKPLSKLDNSLTIVSILDTCLLYQDQALSDEIFNHWFEIKKNYKNLIVFLTTASFSERDKVAILSNKHFLQYIKINFCDDINSKEFMLYLANLYSQNTNETSLNKEKIFTIFNGLHEEKLENKKKEFILHCLLNASIHNINAIAFCLDAYPKEIAALDDSILCNIFISIASSSNQSYQQSNSWINQLNKILSFYNKSVYIIAKSLNFEGLKNLLNYPSIVNLLTITDFLKLIEPHCVEQSFTHYLNCWETRHSTKISTLILQALNDTTTVDVVAYILFTNKQRQSDSERALWNIVPPEAKVIVNKTRDISLLDSAKEETEIAKTIVIDNLYFKELSHFPENIIKILIHYANDSTTLHYLINALKNNRHIILPDFLQYPENQQAAVELFMRGSELIKACPELFSEIAINKIIQCQGDKFNILYGNTHTWAFLSTENKKVVAQNLFTKFDKNEINIQELCNSLKVLNIPLQNIVENNTYIGRILVVNFATFNTHFLLSEIVVHKIANQLGANFYSMYKDKLPVLSPKSTKLITTHIQSSQPLIPATKRHLETTSNLSRQTSSPAGLTLQQPRYTKIEDLLAAPLLEVINYLVKNCSETEDKKFIGENLTAIQNYFFQKFEDNHKQNKVEIANAFALLFKDYVPSKDNESLKVNTPSKHIQLLKEWRYEGRAFFPQCLKYYIANHINETFTQDYFETIIYPTDENDNYQTLSFLKEETIFIKTRFNAFTKNDFDKITLDLFSKYQNDKYFTKHFIQLISKQNQLGVASKPFIDFFRKSLLSASYRENAKNLFKLSSSSLIFSDLGNVVIGIALLQESDKKGFIDKFSTKLLELAAYHPEIAVAIVIGPHLGKELILKKLINSKYYLSKGGADKLKPKEESELLKKLQINLLSQNTPQAAELQSSFLKNLDFLIIDLFDKQDEKTINLYQKEILQSASSNRKVLVRLLQSVNPLFAQTKRELYQKCYAQLLEMGSKTESNANLFFEYQELHNLLYAENESNDSNIFEYKIKILYMKTFIIGFNKDNDIMNKNTNLKSNFISRYLKHLYLNDKLKETLLSGQQSWLISDVFIQNLNSKEEYRNLLRQDPQFAVEFLTNEEPCTVCSIIEKVSLSEPLFIQLFLNSIKDKESFINEYKLGLLLLQLPNLSDDLVHHIVITFVANEKFYSELIQLKIKKKGSHEPIDIYAIALQNETTRKYLEQSSYLKSYFDKKDREMSYQQSKPTSTLVQAVITPSTAVVYREEDSTSSQPFPVGSSTTIVAPDSTLPLSGPVAPPPPTPTISGPAAPPPPPPRPPSAGKGAPIPPAPPKATIGVTATNTHQASTDSRSALLGAINNFSRDKLKKRSETLKDLSQPLHTNNQQIPAKPGSFEISLADIEAAKNKSVVSRQPRKAAASFSTKVAGLTNDMLDKLSTAFINILIEKKIVEPSQNPSIVNVQKEEFLINLKAQLDNLYKNVSFKAIDKYHYSIESKTPRLIKINNEMIVFEHDIKKTLEKLFTDQSATISLNDEQITKFVTEWTSTLHPLVNNQWLNEIPGISDELLKNFTNELCNYWQETLKAPTKKEAIEKKQQVFELGKSLGIAKSAFSSSDNFPLNFAYTKHHLSLNLKILWDSLINTKNQNLPAEEEIKALLSKLLELYSIDKSKLDSFMSTVYRVEKKQEYQKFYTCYVENFKNALIEASKTSNNKNETVKLIAKIKDSGSLAPISNASNSSDTSIKKLATTQTDLLYDAIGEAMLKRRHGIAPSVDEENSSSEEDSDEEWKDTKDKRPPSSKGPKTK